MPQFDFYTFSTQTFWALFSFFSLHFIFMYFYLSQLSSVLKARKKLAFLYTVSKSASSTTLNLYEIFLLKILKK